MFPVTQGTGYPDWTRVSTVVSDLVVDEIGVTVGASPEYGPFYVGAFPTLRVLLGAFLRAKTTYLQVAWYATGTKLRGVGEFVWSVSETASINDAVACLGPYVVIRVYGTATTAAKVNQLCVVATTSDVAAARVSNNKVIYTVTTLSVPGGMRQTEFIPTVTTGPAKLFAISTATTWSVVLVGWLNGNSIYRLASVNQTTTRNQHTVEVNLPPVLCAVRFENGTATAKDFSVSLVTP